MVRFKHILVLLMLVTPLLLPGEIDHRPESHAAPVTAKTRAAQPVGVRVLSEVPASPFAVNWPWHSRTSWSADSNRLVYIGPPEGDIPSAVMLLDLRISDRPFRITNTPAGNAVWSPDHNQIAYTASRSNSASTGPMTVYVKAIPEGVPIDVLPGDQAIVGTSTAKYIHRWIDPTTIAYEEHVGSGLQQLLLVNVPARRLVDIPVLDASFFRWSQNGSSAAGQLTSGQTHFWIWNRREKKLLKSTDGLPGKYHWFEAWSDDGRFALFTAWDGPPYRSGSAANLFRLDIRDGSVTHVASNAFLAAWANGHISYVTAGIPSSLVILRSDNFESLWTDNLGSPPSSLPADVPWSFRPTLAGPYVSYRAWNGEWRVSLVTEKTVMPILLAHHISMEWSPNGSYAAILESRQNAKLTLIRNPLAGQ